MKEKSRVAAAQILKDCLVNGFELDNAINENIKYKSLQTNDKNFCMLLVNEVFRHMGQMDVIIDKYLSNPRRLHIDARIILRVACAEKFFSNSPDYAIVNNAVDAVEAFKKFPLKGLVNAVTRKICALNIKEIDKIDIAHNFPQWLVEIWTKQYGKEKTKLIMENSLKRYPLYINVKSDAEKWEEKLNAKQIAPNLLKGNKNINVIEAEGFDQGEWWVQGFESSIPARLLGDIKGKKVLDCCAAPGGKTAQLITQGANVTAIEKSKIRIEKFKDNLKRLKLDCKIEYVDAVDYKKEKDFDAILIDAPCSATGTIRKNPDVLYNKTQQQIKELVKTQKDILNNMARLLKVDGTMVYATCSLQKEEGEDQISSFLNENKNFELVPIEPEEIFGLKNLINKYGVVRIIPQEINEEISSDGFFVARMKRVK